MQFNPFFFFSFCPQNPIKMFKRKEVLHDLYLRDIQLEPKWILAGHEFFYPFCPQPVNIFVQTDNGKSSSIVHRDKSSNLNLFSFVIAFYSFSNLLKFTRISSPSRPSNVVIYPQNFNQLSV
jgi:hypothetical protein